MDGRCIFDLSLHVTVSVTNNTKENTFFLNRALRKRYQCHVHFSFSFCIFQTYEASTDFRDILFYSPYAPRTNRNLRTITECQTDIFHLSLFASNFSPFSHVIISHMRALQTGNDIALPNTGFPLIIFYRKSFLTIPLPIKTNTMPMTRNNKRSVTKQSSVSSILNKQLFARLRQRTITNADVKLINSTVKSLRRLRASLNQVPQNAPTHYFPYLFHATNAYLHPSNHVLPPDDQFRSFEYYLAPNDRFQNVGNEQNISQSLNVSSLHLNALDPNPRRSSRKRTNTHKIITVPLSLIKYIYTFPPYFSRLYLTERNQEREENRNNRFFQEGKNHTHTH